MCMQQCKALTSRALLCTCHCWLTTVWQCAVAATTSCQRPPARNITLSASLGMSSPVSSPVSSSQILITSLAIYSYPLSCFAVNAHAMGYLGGNGTVTGNDDEEIPEAHIAQCSVNNVVMYMILLYICKPYTCMSR